MISPVHLGLISQLPGDGSAFVDFFTVKIKPGDRIMPSRDWEVAVADDGVA